MPACPKCNQNFRSRKKGACPGCGAPITLIDGKWFLDTGDTKKDFVLYWGKRQAEKLGVNQVITKKSLSFQAEIKFATILLGSAGSYEIAIRALDLFYIDRRFNWMNANSLRYLRNQWDAAVAVAKKQLERERKEIESTEIAVQARPDISIWKELYDNN